MRNSMRFAVVLFFVGILSMVLLMGGDTAEHVAVGGPEGDIALFDMAAGANEPTAEAPTAAVVPFDEDEDDVSAVAGTEVESGDGIPFVVAVEPESAEVEEDDETVEEKEVLPTVVTHVVQRGETLWDIALAYDIDVDTILAANDIPDIHRLQVGQELSILTVRGALHTVRRGESLWDISRAYDVSIDEIVATNNIANPSRIQVNQELIIPGGQAAAAALRREQLVSSSGQLLRNFDWPTTGRISSRYGPRWGRMHNGLDLAVPIGTPIYAAAAGTVTHSGPMGTYGILVIIDHGNGVETRYAHLNRALVRVGQRVQRGALIAHSGNTGNSTGPHLHFEIRHRGQAVDPEAYLRR